MKHILAILAALALACSSMAAHAVEDDITLEGMKTLKSTPADCKRIVENGKKVVALRDEGATLAETTAALLKVNSLRDRQYRITLPLLLNFAAEAYGTGKTLKAKDLVTALNVTCLSDANSEWVYF